jgi:hypothetical protein
VTTRPPAPGGRDLVRTGLLIGIVDGLFSSLLSVFAYHSTVTRLFQGVASVVLGPAAFEGGLRTAGIGLLMHFGVAFAWSAVFLFLVWRWSRVRDRVSSTAGIVAVAALYGPLIWLAMSLVVIPTLAHRPPAITVRWWVQLLGHIPFVGFPIVASSARMTRRTIETEG